jgi:hypothetical protein
MPDHQTAHIVSNKIAGQEKARLPKVPQIDIPDPGGVPRVDPACALKRDPVTPGFTVSPAACSHFLRRLALTQARSRRTSAKRYISCRHQRACQSLRCRNATRPHTYTCTYAGHADMRMHMHMHMQRAALRQLMLQLMRSRCRHGGRLMNWSRRRRTMRPPRPAWSRGTTITRWQLPARSG